MPIHVALGAILVYLLLCAAAAFMGRKRRIGFWGFFFLAILATPFLTAVFIFTAAPARRRAVPKRG